MPLKSACMCLRIEAKIEQKYGPNLLLTRVCNGLTAHDNRAFELCTALMERGGPLSLKNPFCIDVTSRHVQENKVPWFELVIVVANCYFL